MLYYELLLLLLGMFQIAMSLLKCFESSMLELDLEGISSLLKKWRLKSQEFNDLQVELNQSKDNQPQDLIPSLAETTTHEPSSDEPSSASRQLLSQSQTSCWVGSGSEGRGALSRSFSLPASMYEAHMSYEEIMRHVELMPINNESLQKLQEAFALEMISMSEMTLKLPSATSGSTSDGASRSSKPSPSSSNTPHSNHVDTSHSMNDSNNNNGSSNNNNRQLIKQSGKVFSTAASVAASSSNSNNSSGNNLLRSISGSVGSEGGGLSSGSGNGCISGSLSSSKWLERYGDMISQDAAIEMIRCVCVCAAYISFILHFNYVKQMKY